MPDVSSGNVVVGTPVTLSTVFRIDGVATDATGAVSLVVVNPLGAATTYTGGQISHPGVGTYRVPIVTDVAGLWHWHWIVNGQATDEGSFTAETVFDETLGAPDLTDLRVLVPRSRRICEGPYGPALNKPALLDSQLYEMTADACGDIILFTGKLFGHQLLVATRDPLTGFPTRWKTEVVLDEWEVALIATQVALNYFFWLFRDLKTSETIKNEGTEWSYSLSANVMRDYIGEIKMRRDLALTGLQKHHPVLERFASNIRVRDAATVAVLEWWDNVSPGPGGSGMPGGQEAAVIPWTSGWSGPGFTP